MKKSILVFIGMLLITATTFATDTKTATLTVVVKNLNSPDGKVSVTLFNTEGSFLNTGIISKAVTIENGGSVSITFENLEIGSYAASVIHDENGNGELDTATFGIPTEPYGFSNDARGMFGPPTFEDSKFTIDGDKKIEISVE